MTATGPHAICRVTDEFVANCSHCQGGIVHLFGDHRCEACGDLLDAGTTAWQTPPPESAVLCRTCHEERSSE